MFAALGEIPAVGKLTSTLSRVCIAFHISRIRFLEIPAAGPVERNERAHCFPVKTFVILTLAIYRISSAFAKGIFCPIIYSQRPGYGISERGDQCALAHLVC